MPNDKKTIRLKEISFAALLTLAPCIACHEVTVGESGILFHFTTDRSAYAPGDTVRITLTSDGSTAINGGFCPAWMDRWTAGAGWTQATPNVVAQCSAILMSILPGESRNTWFIIPASFNPGEYRVSFLNESATRPWNTPPFAVTGPPASRLELPDSASALYWSDAITLAIRELQRGTPLERQSIEVPDALVTDLYGALAALYRSPLPARDSVVQRFRLHAPRQTDVLTVGVETTASWVDWWRHGSNVTYNPAVDTLVDKFGLRVQRFWIYSAPVGQSVTLIATRPLNLPALAPLFARVSGVRYAEAGAARGDESDITALPAAGGWQLEFKLGWGDCPAGCIYRHFWTFSVDASRAVRFEGSRGPAAGVGIP